MPGCSATPGISPTGWSIEPSWMSTIVTMSTRPIGPWRAMVQPYQGSIIKDLKRYDLYLYRCAGGEPLLMAKYGSGEFEVIIGDLSNYNPVIQEAQKRAEASGLLSETLF